MNCFLLELSVLLCKIILDLGYARVLIHADHMDRGNFKVHVKGTFLAFAFYQATKKEFLSTIRILFVSAFK